MQFSDNTKVNSLRWTLGIFITLLLLAIVFRYWNHSYKNIISSDGKGYYAYLPATIIYHDLDYEYYFNGELDVDKEYTSNYIFYIEGGLVNKYPCGVSVLLLPFFLLACLLSFLTGTPIDGYSFYFQILVSLGAIFYVTAGIRILYGALIKLNFKERFSGILCLSILFGTNLTNYTVWDPSMSHAYSFFIIAFTLNLLLNIIEFPTTHKFILLGICLGIVYLIRPVNLIIILALPLIFKNFAAFKSFILNSFRNFKYIIAIILSFMLIAGIQNLFWYLQNGLWYNYTYLGEYFNFTEPQILKTLFSYRKGFFIYTPFFLLLIPASIHLIIKREFFRLTGVLLFFGTFSYITASWWCWYYGGSFGQRVYIDIYPLIAIPIAYFICNTSNLMLKYFIIPFIAITVFLNLIQSYQFKNSILHYDSMTKEGYWDVFLKTGSKYKFSLFKNKYDKPDILKDRKLLYRKFLDFEYLPDELITHYNSDYADNAHSGNKVYEFNHNQNSFEFAFNVNSTEISEKHLDITGYIYNSNASLKCEFLINDSIIQIPIKQEELKNSEDWPYFHIKSAIQLNSVSQNNITVKINCDSHNQVNAIDDITISVY